MVPHSPDNLPLVELPTPETADVTPRESRAEPPLVPMSDPREDVRVATEAVGVVRGYRGRTHDGRPEEMDEAAAAYFGRMPLSDRRLHDDVIWVSQHLDSPEVPLNKFPSQRAWSLLHWARENRNDFFKSMLPSAEKDAIKSLAAGGLDEGEWEADKGQEHLVAELRSMLFDLVKESQSIQADPKYGLVELPESAKPARLRGS